MKERNMQMGERVFTPSFKALLATQFLGAANDNLLKQLIALQVVAGIWQNRAALPDWRQCTAMF